MTVRQTDVRPARPCRSSRRLRALPAAVAVIMVVAAPGNPAWAAPSSPAPTAPATGSPTPTATSSPTPSRSAPSPSATPSPAAAAADPGATAGLTLTVGSPGGPVAGAFFSDLGAYAFSGSVTGLADGATITIYRRSDTGVFGAVATAAVTGGAYATSLPVTDAGTFTFRASAVITGDPDAVIDSAPVPVVVARAGVTITSSARTIDALQNPTITGSVFPARPGVEIDIDVLRSGKYRAVARAVTGPTGRYSVVLGYGQAHLATYEVRAAYPAVNTARWTKSAAITITRAAVLNAVVSETTAAEVAKTYHPGCPVGRSRLRTISMNFYGRDHLVHRGVIIIRSDLAAELIRGFGQALDHRYPVAKMNNPNAYGGNDPRQMKADNTSGFNCRKVVGNPYAQSPHSYGIAIDVNTVQNPYRDSRGKWWPSNGKSYIDRDDKRAGMLFKGSALTASLRHDHFFWGGSWNPGRDYQHFEYRP